VKEKKMNKLLQLSPALSSTVKVEREAGNITACVSFVRRSEGRMASVKGPASKRLLYQTI